MKTFRFVMNGGLPAILALLALISPAVPAAAAAQSSPADSLPRGAVVERVWADSAHSYALYLPATWTAERRWPVLLLLDPGGRATLPAERFREAAERHGWVLMSAYDVRNGGPDTLALNDAAVDAMLVDAQQRFALDPERLYFAGFSGMARYGWRVAVALDGRTAGLIGMGAGFPDRPGLWGAMLRGAKPFSFFGIVGTRDPNLREMEDADAALGATAFPHRLTLFDGDHEWPPAAVAAEAIDWLERQRIQRPGASPPSP
jgi:predicted esterase